jgi:hypothetical protein
MGFLSIRESILNFYTVILDFRDGTYVAQVDAETETEAVVAWALKLKREAFVPDHSGRLADAIITDLPDSPPVKLTSLSGAWCVSIRLDDYLALLNIVLSQRLATVH